MKKITLLIMMLIVFASISNAQHSALRTSVKSVPAKTLIVPRVGSILTTSCDTTMPTVLSTGTCYDSLALYGMGTNLDTGYIAGQNIYGFSASAEKFPAVSGSGATVSGVMVYWAAKIGSTGNTYAAIYTVGANGGPDMQIGATSAIITKSAIDTSTFGINSNNFYTFSTPPSVGASPFFVVINYPTTFTYNSDELGMLTMDQSCSALSGDSTGWFDFGSYGWYSYMSMFGSNFDMMIFPVVCSTPVAPVANFAANDTAINAGTCINYTDLSTNAPTSWSWTFNGATPATSTVKNPTGICYNTAGNYTVRLIATNAIGSDTLIKTNYITVTLDTNPPVANFIASATNITPGTTVNFTDLSSNVPTGWLWNVTPSLGWTYTGGTTSTSQNPKITFNFIGPYTIALTATNSYGNNTATFNNYINVSNSPPLTGCDTLKPPSFAGSCSDSLVLYMMGTSGDTGYVCGQNAYYFNELAQRYTASSNDTISEVFVMYAAKAGTTGNTCVKIYTVDATGKPGTLLGTSDSIVKSAIDTSNFGNNSHNVYHFSTPVITSGNFFVSVVIPPTFTYPTDELGILCENITCSAVDDSAGWFNSSITAGWMSYKNGFGSNFDLSIFPFVSCTTTGTCSAMFNMYADTTILHHYYIVNMASGTPPISYVWSWGDGTFDSIPYPSHTYAAAGYYNICLSIIDSVGCTNTFCDSTYIMKSGNAVISITVIPETSVGIHEELSNEHFVLYPNPANDNITISDFRFENLDLKIYDIVGNIVLEKTLYSKVSTIDISVLAKGMYFVKIKTENGVAIKKFVKE